MSEKIREAFEYLFNTHLKYICVPSEGNKKKAEGCFNSVNDYGKEPTEKACRKCWGTALYGDQSLFRNNALESQLEKVTRERDEAVKTITHACNCLVCQPIADNIEVIENTYSILTTFLQSITPDRPKSIAKPKKKEI